MPHDPITLLSDIRTAAEFIFEQTRGRKLTEYESDRVLSAAVERHFITIGEALNRLVRVDETAAAALGDYPQIIGLRNIVVHGYDIIEHPIVWGIIQNEVPRLLSKVQDQIRKLGGS
jgi:uncharacterized protein with HEPN domain